MTKLQLPFLLILALTFCLHSREYQERKFYGATMELREGVMHGVGQLGSWKGEKQHINKYMDVVGQNTPAIFMVYTGLRRDTFPESEQLLEKLDTMQALESRHPNTSLIPQLGLYIVDFVDAIEESKPYTLYGLDSLISIMNHSGRPWYVRIGYEFNGGWNGYQPDAYKIAYRVIAERFREKATVPVANLWCYHPTNKKWPSYYPGDDIVDWWSIDLFEEKFLSSQNTLDFLDSADAHGKPVMIGEATPKDGNVDDGIEDWNAWFDPYFQLLADHPGIKGMTYLNWDWTLTRWPGWGETRLETSDTISTLWKKELENPIFVHGPYEANWFESSSAIHEQKHGNLNHNPYLDFQGFIRKNQSYRLNGRALP